MFVDKVIMSFLRTVIPSACCTCVHVMQRILNCLVRNRRIIIKMNKNFLYFPQIVAIKILGGHRSYGYCTKSNVPFYFVSFSGAT